MEIYWKFIG